MRTAVQFIVVDDETKCQRRLTSHDEAERRREGESVYLAVAWSGASRGRGLRTRGWGLEACHPVNPCRESCYESTWRKWCWWCRWFDAGGSWWVVNMFPVEATSMRMCYSLTASHRLSPQIFLFYYDECYEACFTDSHTTYHKRKYMLNFTDVGLLIPLL